MSARKLSLIAPIALLLTLCLILAWQIPAQAHGVSLQAERGDAVVVSGLYSDGEPMSFVKIKITNPDGKTHQVGNTDAGGRFAFVPGQAGKWLVTATDGMGHKGEIAWQQTTAKAGPDAVNAPAQPAKASKWERAAWGLSLLFWLSGLVFWRKGFRNSRQA